ncbi:MAG: LuxR family transcriptional regulator [Pseudomonadota bacterium]
MGEIGDWGHTMTPRDDAGAVPLLRAALDEPKTGDKVVRSALDAVIAADGMERAVVTVRDAFQLKHVSYLAARYGASPERDPYVRSTYPALWMARYLMKRYWRVDPIITEGFRRAAPFDWATIDRSTPRIAEFFDDAARFKVGQNGMCVPLTDRSGRRGILSLSSDLEGNAWTDYAAAFLKDFIEVGAALHARGLKEVFGDAKAPPRLSPREKEVLRWTAEGKEVPDIAIITSLSEHTVRTYIKSARLKLDCGTKAQAAVKAERLNLLNEDEA